MTASKHWLTQCVSSPHQVGVTMTMRINFNLGSVFAHQNLRDVDRLMEKTLDHLSSGIRIRRAGDDPAGMVLANNLRHHLKGIEKATQNSEEGISMVQTAEGAMDEVSNLLLRIRTLTVQAANEGANNPASLAAIQAEFDSAISSITRTATDTRFGSLPLLQGQLSDNTINVADRDVLHTVLHDATKLPGGIKLGSALTTTVAAPTTLGRSAVTVTLTGAVIPLPGTTVMQGLDQNGTTLDAVDGKSFTVTGPLGNRALTIPVGATINDVVAQVNAYSAQTGARASYDSATGQLRVESTAFGNGPLSIASADMTSGVSTIGLLDSDTSTVLNVTLTGASSPLPGSTVIQGLDQNGTILDAVDGKTLTVTGPLGSQAVTIPAGATIDSAVTLINTYTTLTGAVASYDPNTGILGIASTTPGNGALSIASADMTSLASGVGLLDVDTTTVPVTNSFATPATDQTVQLAYTDAGGTARTLTLTQDPKSAGGLTFTNLLGGPEGVAPFTAFDPGAFSVTFLDTSGGTSGTTMTLAPGSYGAIRQSTTFIQTGALANQTTTIDIPDMRAGALGHTANLAVKGYASLQDLLTSSALTTGNTNSAFAVIDAAIAEVNAARGNAGAIQANALESSLNSLRVSFENLTSSESQLRDTDFAAESALYARHNIVYQAATAMLAQANQIPRSILEMLK